MSVNTGVDWNEPLGMGGSWPEGLLVTSGSRLVRMEFSALDAGGTYLICLASVTENGLAVAW